jgi:photosystem II stability/assembly factor-like uncharacterized protein
MQLFAATDTGILSITEHAGTYLIHPLLVDSRIQCLAIDPRNAATIYAGTFGRGLIVSRDAGRHWRVTNMPAKNVFSVAVSAVDGAAYAGCEPSMIYKSEDGDCWRELESLREVPSQPSWSFPPRPWTSHIRSLALHPKDPDVILAGVELGGVMLSEDGGRSWEDHRPGAQKDAHQIAWHPQDGIRAYEAGGGGPAWSRDGGRTWQAADRGLDRRYTWALAVHPYEPDTWFISASRGPSDAHSGGDARAYIYRWRGDGPWHRVEEDLPVPLSSMPYVLLCGEGFLLAGLHDGRLFLSHDQGDSWEHLPIDAELLFGLRDAVLVQI